MSNQQKGRGGNNAQQVAIHADLPPFPPRRDCCDFNNGTGMAQLSNASLLCVIHT